MNNFSVLNRDDRNEPVVIGPTVRENFAVHFVFEDHYATILRAMYNKCVAGVKLDRLAVSREASHQVGSSSNRRRPTGKAISELEECVFGDCVEIMFAINESAQAFYGDFEERIESLKNLVFAFRHHHLLSVHGPSPGKRSGAPDSHSFETGLCEMPNWG